MMIRGVGRKFERGLHCSRHIVMFKTANSKAFSVTSSELTCMVVVCKLVKEAVVLVCVHTYSIAKIKQCMLR